MQSSEGDQMEVMSFTYLDLSKTHSDSVLNEFLICHPVFLYIYMAPFDFTKENLLLHETACLILYLHHSVFRYIFGSSDDIKLSYTAG